MTLDEKREKQKSQSRMTVSDVAKNARKRSSKTEQAPVKQSKPDSEPVAQAKEARQSGSFLGLSRNDTNALLLQTLPTLLGAAFGGVEGAAEGAKAGQAGVRQFNQSIEKEREDERRLQAAAQKRKDELAKEERAFGRQKELKQMDRATKRESDLNSREAKLRSERLNLPTTKDTQAVVASYSRIQAAAENPSAAGDIALIFNFMKMNDPGSVVREGEFATAQNAAGIPERIRAQYNRALRGERLTDVQRGDFVETSRGLLSAQLQAQGVADQQFREIAERQGLKPENVLIDFNAPQPPRGDQGGGQDGPGQAGPGPLTRAVQAVKPQAQAATMSPDRRRRLEELRAKQARSNAEAVNGAD